MNISNPEDALSAQHKSWLQLACTKQMLQVLERQKQLYLDRASSVAWNEGQELEVTKAVISARAINGAILALTNTETFLKILTQ